MSLFNLVLLVTFSLAEMVTYHEKILNGVGGGSVVKLFILTETQLPYRNLLCTMNAYGVQILY